MSVDEVTVFYTKHSKFVAATAYEALEQQVLAHVQSGRFPRMETVELAVSRCFLPKTAFAVKQRVLENTLQLLQAKHRRQFAEFSQATTLLWTHDSAPATPFTNMLGRSVQTNEYVRTLESLQEVSEFNHLWWALQDLPRQVREWDRQVERSSCSAPPDLSVAQVPCSAIAQQVSA